MPYFRAAKVRTFFRTAKFLSFFFLSGQRHDKPCTRGKARVENDVAAHVASQRAGNRKADARTDGIFVKLYKLAEDVFGLLWRNANAVVLNDESAGPRLADGRQLLVLVADSQNQYKGVFKDWFKTVVMP